MTIKLEITPEQIDDLRYQRYNHLAPLVQRRMETLWLKAYSLPHQQIEEIVGVSGNTMREYFELYRQGGIEKLKELHYYRPQSELYLTRSQTALFQRVENAKRATNPIPLGGRSAFRPSILK